MKKTMTDPAQISAPTRLNWKKRAICWLAFWLLNLLRLTYRISYHNIHHLEKARQQHPKQSYGLALWHEHALSTICGHVFKGIMPMVSQSEDGEYITYVLQRWGYTAVRGSSSRGGKEAKDAQIAAVADGVPVSLTVDGPRGPRQKVKSGIVAIARETGLAIVPVIGFADRYWEFRSWDRFKLAKPWAKIAIIYGPPIVVPTDTHGEAFAEKKQLLAEALEVLEIQAREVFAATRASLVVADKSN